MVLMLFYFNSFQFFVERQKRRRCEGEDGSEEHGGKKGFTNKVLLTV